MFKSGDVVYFKECKNSSHRKASKGARFKGTAFGIFLGHVPPFGKDPSKDEVIMMVGSCGFLTFDDVAEFLGDEMAQKCVQKYEAKYYTQNAPAVKGTDGQLSPLVGVDGRPLENGKRGLLVSPETAERMRLAAETRKVGETKPLLTVGDIQKQIRAMTPEQIKEALVNAKLQAEKQFSRPLTPDEEKDVKTKVCGALGVDPETLQRSEGRGPTDESDGEGAGAAPAAQLDLATPETKANGSESSMDEAPIFPKRGLPEVDR